MDDTSARVVEQILQAPVHKQRSIHVFGDVEAKEAARQCGATVEKNTRGMWESLWKKA